MARGGFISSTVYMRRARDLGIPVAEAAESAINAATVGKLSTRGRPARTPEVFTRLKLLFDPSAKPEEKLPEQEISRDSWAGVSKDDNDERAWDSGYLDLSGGLGLEVWEGIKLREAEANVLLKQLAPRFKPVEDEPESSAIKERRRGVTWDEWVAVVATLAYEHLIDVNSTDADILQLAANRLGRRHEASTKRMKSAALALVARWRRTPPRPPAPTRVDLIGSTSKP